MRCPTLADLPLPPPGKTGWPWTEESPQLPELMADGSPWPRISIITPSYNQVQYIEETIRSILLQGYPSLEYIVMDGGSSDGAWGVVQKYEKWLAYSFHGPDGGQSDAINKGVGRSTGEIVQWINSDDVLVEGALRAVAQASAGGTLIVATTVINFDDTNEYIVGNTNLTMRDWVKGTASYHQPGVWLVRAAWAAAGCLPTDMNYGFDFAHLWGVMNSYPNISYLSAPSVRFRLHPSSKTCSNGDAFYREMLATFSKLAKNPQFGNYRSFFEREIKFAAAIRWFRYASAKQGKARFVKQAVLLNFRVRHFKLLRFSLGAIRNRLFGRRKVQQPLDA